MRLLSTLLALVASSVGISWLASTGGLSASGYFGFLYLVLVRPWLGGFLIDSSASPSPIATFLQIGWGAVGDVLAFGSSAVCLHWVGWGRLRPAVLFPAVATGGVLVHWMFFLVILWRLC